MKDRAETVFEKLKEWYPDAECELKFGSTFELLVAVILSAQCTDKRVNAVTEKLFKLYNKPEDFAQLEPSELAPHIYSCGFYNAKAKAIVEASRSIISDFGGRVPETVEELRKLRGVGGKTANVVFAVGCGGQAIAVDTHVFRVSNRTGLAQGKTPPEVERKLEQIIDRSKHSEFHHLLLFHGRYTCKSRKPECGECVISGLCEKHNILG